MLDITANLKMLRSWIVSGSATTEQAIGLIDALLADHEAKSDYPVCEKCGKEIQHVKISLFHYDGSDSEYEIPVGYDKQSGCVFFQTYSNWTAYDLTDEERKDDIRCPHCGKFPFDDGVEIETREPVEVLMWTSERPCEEENDAEVY